MNPTLFGDSTLLDVLGCVLFGLLTLGAAWLVADTLYPIDSNGVTGGDDAASE